MKRILITIMFDIKDDEPLENRDYDRFILEYEEGKYEEKLRQYFEEMKYSWDDYEKGSMGYKMIMSMENVNLSDLKVY